MKTITISLMTSLVLALVAYFVIDIYSAQQALGSAFTGSTAVQSTATTTVVGPQSKITIFSATKACTARAIGINDGTGVGIRFITADPAGVSSISSTTLTTQIGLSQAGSTTVTYDSGLNGCGRWVAMASASTTITVVEYQ